MPHIPSVERLNRGEPILSNDPSHSWESKVTFNPACALVSSKDELARIIPQLPFDPALKQKLNDQPALCFLLYRAQGSQTPEHNYTHSSMGLAVLTSDLKLLARHVESVLSPDTPFDNLGVEDGRITKNHDHYVLLYTAYASGSPQNRIRIAVASSQDFIRWEKHGLIKGNFNGINNKNAILFPEKIDGKFVILHRPMEGDGAMAIHWAEANDLFGGWESRGILMKPI